MIEFLQFTLRFSSSNALRKIELFLDSIKFIWGGCLVIFLNMLDNAIFFNNFRQVVWIISKIDKIIHAHAQFLKLVETGLGMPVSFYNKQMSAFILDEFMTLINLFSLFPWKRFKTIKLKRSGDLIKNSLMIRALQKRTTIRATSLYWALVFD